MNSCLEVRWKNELFVFSWVKIKKSHTFIASNKTKPMITLSSRQILTGLFLISLFIFSGCKSSKLIGYEKSETYRESSPGSIVGTAYHAGVISQPTRDNTNLNLKLTKDEKLEYKTYYNQREKYEVKRASKGQKWGITFFTFGGIALTAGFMVADTTWAGTLKIAGGLAAATGLLALFSKRETSTEYRNPVKIPGPPEYEHNETPLANSTILIKYEDQRKQDNSDNQGKIKINLADFNFGVTYKTQEFSFNLFKDNIPFDNSVKFDNLSWMKPLGVVINSQALLKTDYDSWPSTPPEEILGWNSIVQQKRAGWSRMSFPSSSAWIKDSDINIFYYSARTDLMNCDQSKLAFYADYFKARGEFETDNEYYARIESGKKMQADVLAECLDKTENERINKIRDSYHEIDLTIQDISIYDLINQSFIIQINDEKQYVLIPIKEAPAFKENAGRIKVTGEKQLLEDGETYDIFNIKIIHPTTGSVYIFGRQKEPLYQGSIAQDSRKTEKGIPNLSTTAIFSEPSANRMLDAGETGNIDITIFNSGNASAHNIVINLTAENNPYIFWDKSKTITDIAPDASATASFSITATKGAKNRNILFTFTFDEQNGFFPPPLEMQISSQEFKPPKLVMVESGITETAGSMNNIIENNEIIQTTVLVQNKGFGVAKSATAEIRINDPNIKLIDGELFHDLGDLSPGDSRTITFSFAVNNNYKGADLLPIEITLTESEKKYGETRVLGLQLKKINLTSKQIIINGQQSDEVVIPGVSLTADVDKNIPSSSKKYPNKYALIIGNEDYSSYQTGLSSEINVDFALNDAIVFKNYITSACGFEESQIQLLPNATRAQMIRGIEWLGQLMEIENGEAEIIFYYSGHGLPDEVTKEPYLIPVDVSGSNLKDGLSLMWLFQKLNEKPSKKITLFLDACFSGGGRNQPLLANKGVKVKPTSFLPMGNMVVFASSSGEESSAVYREKQHGLFTYFLLKKIQETGGDVTYKALFDYLESEVKKQSILINQKVQTPQVSFGSEADNSWETWELK